MKESMPSPNKSEKALKEKVSILLEDWYGYLTSGDTAIEPPFFGFGSAEDVREHLITKGVDVGHLNIEVKSSGREVIITPEAGGDPIYSEYFEDPDRREEMRQAAKILSYGYVNERD